MSVSLGHTANFSGSASAYSAPPVVLLGFGDLNGDGLVDVIGHQVSPTDGGLAPLRIAIQQANGTFTTDAQLFAGVTPSFISPRVIVGDFTGDGRNDFVVYDAGTYDWSVRMTVGREPVLFVAGADGRFTASSALTDALRPLVQAKGADYRGGYQVDLTLGIKDVAAADIDGDGDLDLWVESTGSANITSHFVINNGGSFSIDINSRMPDKVLFGPGFGTTGDYFRYGIGRFIDANSDGRPDLLLGQIRDNDATHIGQSSYVVLNDGTGRYTASNKIALPLPAFYNGYTSVQDVAEADINGDGRKDLLLLHTRNDDVTGPGVEPAWTGTFVQLLVQGDGGQYTDETARRLGDQSAWSNSSLAPGNHASRIVVSDLDKDGVMDFVLSYGWDRPSDSRPLVFLGNANGTFRVIDNAAITGGDAYFGEGIRAVDLNGDGRMDFVHFDAAPGANGVYEGAGSDDHSILVAQFATKPLGLVFRSAASNDAFVGSNGLDTAIYSGARADYTLARDGGSFTVSGPSDGADTLTGVERLRFGDSQVALDIDGNAGKAYRLYKAAFDRTPDLGGLGYQMNVLDQGFSLAQVASAFIASPEFQSMYGNVTDTQFVTLLYQNVLDRAPDAGGLAYHLNDLAHGTTRAQILSNFSESPENQANVIGAIANGMTYEWSSSPV